MGVIEIKPSLNGTWKILSKNKIHQLSDVTEVKVGASVF